MICTAGTALLVRTPEGRALGAMNTQFEIERWTDSSVVTRQRIERCQGLMLTIDRHARRVSLYRRSTDVTSIACKRGAVVDLELHLGDRAQGGQPRAR
jgi:hypothetical protein